MCWRLLRRLYVVCVRVRDYLCLLPSMCWRLLDVCMFFISYVCACVFVCFLYCLYALFVFVYVYVSICIIYTCTHRVYVYTFYVIITNSLIIISWLSLMIMNVYVTFTISFSALPKVLHATRICLGKQALFVLEKCTHTQARAHTHTYIGAVDREAATVSTH